MQARCQWGAARKSAKAQSFKASASQYDSVPTQWEVNAESWSLKAIEVFKLGKINKKDNEYVGYLDSAVKDQEEGNTAIDFSVFAYRDNSWRLGYYKYAGLLQKVNCQKSALGKLELSYVKSAYLYYDQKSDDQQIDSIRPEEYSLKRQYSEMVQERIFDLVGRSFFYSINSASEYARVFQLISDRGIDSATAIANIIARLNASCRNSDRSKCGQIGSSP